MTKGAAYQKNEQEEGKQSRNDNFHINTAIECTVFTDESDYNTLDETKGGVSEYNTLEETTQIKTRSVQTQTTNELPVQIRNELPVQISSYSARSIICLQVVCVVLLLVIVVMVGTIGFLMLNR